LSDFPDDEGTEVELVLSDFPDDEGTEDHYPE
jgi:hypothetical protein